MTDVIYATCHVQTQNSKTSVNFLQHEFETDPNSIIVIVLEDGISD